MRKRVLCTLVALVAAAAAPAWADSFTPSHSCYKPVKPYEFTDKWQVENFKLDVERFRRCIEEFLEEQQEAIRRHKAAADEAVEDWNRFVQLELN